MNLLQEVWIWFGDADDIGLQVWRHLYLSYLPVVGAAAVALPVGLYIGHRRRFEFVAITLANLGRAIPSFAILSMALIVSLNVGLGLGFWPTFTALFFLSLPPILVNVDVGVRGVDPDIVEAARGNGASEWDVLRGIEIPLGAPLIVAGLRTAAVQSVATATLGAFVGAGGLGDYIRLGIRAHHNDVLLGGAILVALLAIGTELAFGAFERAVRPRSVSSRGSREDNVAPMKHLAQARTPDPGGLAG